MTEQDRNEWLPEEISAENDNPMESGVQTAAYAEQTEPKVAGNKKPTPRYVGRVTLGITMILVGLLITAGLMMPSLDLTWLAKLAPLILVFLGGEILVASIRRGDRQIKIGFGMTFLCLFLIGGSIFFALLPDLWETFGPPVYERVDEQARAKQDAVYAQIDPTSVRNLSITTNNPFEGENLCWYANVSLTDEVTDKTMFAQVALPLVQALADQQVNRLYLSGENQSEHYALNLENIPALANATAESLEKLVERSVDVVSGDMDVVSITEKRYEEMKEKGMLAMPDAVKQAYEDGYKKGCEETAQQNAMDQDLSKTDQYENGYEEGFQDAENQLPSKWIEYQREDPYQEGYCKGYQDAKEGVSYQLDEN